MNEKDMRIIISLANNPNSTGKKITDKTGLSESTVSKRLNKLKKKSIVDYETCSPHDDKNYTGKCWHILDDPDTFATLLKMFIGTEHLEDFSHSPYVGEMEVGTVFRIIIDTVSEHMKSVQPLVEMLGLPATRESLAVHQSQRISDGIAKMNQAMEQLREFASTMPPHSTFGDIKRKFKEEHSDS